MHRDVVNTTKMGFKMTKMGFPQDQTLYPKRTLCLENGHMLALSLRSFARIAIQVVVYFDRPLGAAHFKHCFLHFSHV